MYFLNNLKDSETCPPESYRKMRLQKREKVQQIMTSPRLGEKCWNWFSCCLNPKYSMKIFWILVTQCSKSRVKVTLV